MNRIDKLFEEKKGNILSIYFTAGYPELESTVPVIRALTAHGADMIEIGVPFSDPVADGPAIQYTNGKALANGITLRKIFAQLKGIRQYTRVPLLLMSYFNPVLHYGVEAFCRDAAACGIDGVILPDLPVEEYLVKYQPLFTKYGLRNILLVTPQTPPGRIRYLDEHSNGFLYVVSSRSTTGTRETFSGEQMDYFKRLKEMKLRNPLVAGFGISNHTTFSQACRWLDGAIVGSAYVKTLRERSDIDQITKSFMRTLKPTT
jgi:tryptophan synthase alpha chain